MGYDTTVALDVCMSCMAYRSRCRMVWMMIWMTSKAKTLMIWIMYKAKIWMIWVIFEANPDDLDDLRNKPG